MNGNPRWMRHDFFDTQSSTKLILQDMQEDEMIKIVMVRRSVGRSVGCTMKCFDWMADMFFTNIASLHENK